MTTIESSVQGNKGLSMAVSPNDFEGNQVFIRRVGESPVTGIVYTQWEAYQFILAVAKAAGLKTDLSDTDLWIGVPEDPAALKRKDDVAREYFATTYKYLEADQKRIVDRLVEMEQKAGVQW